MLFRLARAIVLGAVVVIPALLATPAQAHAQEFKVVVNSANSVESLSADEASKLFLKQTLKFGNGIAATPIDQRGATRTAFVKSIHGRSERAVDTYWQQQVFAGKDIPPATVSSDEDVIAFVRKTPGGIGYVSSAAGLAGVKTVVIK